MRMFALYRKNPPPEYIENGYANPPDQPQLEGVVFSNGEVCIRWMTPLGSISWWKDFETFEKVHGHPEYDSRIEFYDVEVDEEEPGEPFVQVHRLDGINPTSPSGS